MGEEIVLVPMTKKDVETYPQYIVGRGKEGLSREEIERLIKVLEQYDKVNEHPDIPVAMITSKGLGKKLKKMIE